MRKWSLHTGCKA